MNVAFVIGLGYPGLATVRSLGRNGVPVIGLDWGRDNCGFASRYCTAKICPSPIRQPEELSLFLRKEGERLDRPGILFVSSDAAALFVFRHAHELAGHFRFSLPSPEVQEALVNKRKQYELAERMGIPCPSVFYPESPEEADRIAGHLEYPVFLKPYVGHLWREHFANKGFKVGNRQELLRRFQEVFARGLPVMVQSIILGPITNNYAVSGYIAGDGRPVAVFTTRKIRQYPVEFGVGTLVESIHYPELADLGLRLMQGLGHRGIGEVEFKRDESDGELKFIEINPRLWLQYGLAEDCGLNLVMMQYRDLAGLPPVAAREFTAGVRWLDPFNDLYSVVGLIRRRQLSLRELVTSWSRVRSHVTFARDDMGPFWVVARNGIRTLARDAWKQVRRR